jgi:hypothetical protein
MTSLPKILRGESLESLRQGLLLAAALAVAAAGGTRPALAAEIPAEAQVRVLLASGRQFTAELDRRTDAATLWLRWGQGTDVILRPIDWDRVVRVEIAGETFSGDVLRRAVILVRQELPLASNPPRQMPPAAEPAEPSTRPAGPSSILPRPNTVAGEAVTAPPRVRALSVEASLGKWGPGVDTDGLIVEISPLDEQGDLVPVQGTVEAELIGQGASQTAGGEFATLGHWVQSVWPEDFGYRGARCRLPFQAVQPEFDLRWAAKGMVHVRLSVPGEGVFEATAAMTRIRPASGFRDNYQETTGRRFLPNERTTRSASY